MQRLRGIATAAGVQELAKELRDGGTLRRLAAAWTAASPSTGQQAALPAAAGPGSQPEAPAGNLLAALEAAAGEALQVPGVEERPTGDAVPSSGVPSP